MRHELATAIAFLALTSVLALPAGADAYGEGWSRLAGDETSWEKGDRSLFAGSIGAGAGVYRKQQGFGYAAEAHATGTAHAFGRRFEVAHLGAQADTVRGAALQLRLGGLTLADERAREVSWGTMQMLQVFRLSRSYLVGPIPVTFEASAGVVVMAGLSLGVEDAVVVGGRVTVTGYVGASAVAGISYLGCGAEAGVEATIELFGLVLEPQVVIHWDGSRDTHLYFTLTGVHMTARLFAWAGCVFVASWELPILDETYGGSPRRDLLAR